MIKVLFPTIGKECVKGRKSIIHTELKTIDKETEFK